MLTLGLSATLRQFYRPKYYTVTIFRLKISISKDLGYSSIGKTMTRDLRFRPAIVCTLCDIVYCSCMHALSHKYRVYAVLFPRLPLAVARFLIFSIVLVCVLCVTNIGFLQ